MKVAWTLADVLLYFWDQPMNILLSRVPSDNPVTADVGQILSVIQLGRAQSSRCFAFFGNKYCGIKSIFLVKR